MAVRAVAVPIRKTFITPVSIAQIKPETVKTIEKKTIEKTIVTTNKDMAFKDLFKRKVGGSVIGNLIRKGVNLASGGILGNGALKLQPGQTTQQNNLIALQGVGAAAAAFNQNTPTYSGAAVPDSPAATAIKKGVIMQYAKSYWYVVLIPVLGMLYFIFRPKKRGGRR